MIKKFKNYNDCLKYLFNLERAGIKYDLKNIRTLLRLLNNPQNNFKSVHIAGTNGKGSVSSIINSVLMEKGFKTGLYTSPHILDFRERIRVNGKYISKKFIMNFVNKYFKDIETIKPSFFEVTTALTFDYFSSQKIKYAVIETGLGGRLDSTNILRPAVTIITALSVDHTDFLGNTIEKITAEKGGIIKKGVPLVTGNIPVVSVKILNEIAKKKTAEVFNTSDKKLKITGKSETGFYFAVENREKIFYPLTGDYQINNIKTSLKAIDVIGEREKINFDNGTLTRGFRNLKINSGLYGRFELISVNPKIVVDVSHNEQAIKNIRANLKYFTYERLFIIFAMMQDKDYKKCVNEIGKLDAKIILTKPSYKRAAEPEELFKAVRNHKGKFILKKNIKESFEFVKDNSKRGDLILVTGSFYLAGDFLVLFNKFNKST